MAFQLLSGTETFRDVPTAATTTITKDELLYWAANDGAKPCDGSNETVENLVGVAQEAVTTTGTASTVRVMLLRDDQLWKVDTTNDMAATMLWENHLMTDGGNINNNATEDTSTNAVVKILETLGATTDKKAVARINYVGNSA
jgi:hypothetical protein